MFGFEVILNFFLEQIQNSGLNPVNIPCENLAYQDSWYIQNRGILNNWGIFRITLICRIKFAQNSQLSATLPFKN